MAETDREALQELLRRFGVSPDETGEHNFTPDDVILSAGHGGVGGYSGCFIRFGFDEDGKFREADIFE
jgi:hypothetical protein